MQSRGAQLAERLGPLRSVGRTRAGPGAPGRQVGQRVAAPTSSFRIAAESAGWDGHPQCVAACERVVELCSRGDDGALVLSAPEQPGRRESVLRPLWPRWSGDIVDGRTPFLRETVSEMRQVPGRLGGRGAQEPGEPVTLCLRLSVEADCVHGPPMSPAEIAVLLADDDGRYRATMRTLIDATEGMGVVAEAEDGRQAVDLAISCRPDVVLMDVRMPRSDGLTAIERLQHLGSTARIIVPTTFDLDDYVYRALRAGACGFLLKDTSPSRLLDCITVAAAGEALLAPSVTRRLIDRFTRTGGTAKRDLDAVTPREREILALITRGLPNDEIQHHLHLSRGTIKTHIGRLISSTHATAPNSSSPDTKQASRTSGRTRPPAAGTEPDRTAPARVMRREIRDVGLPPDVRHEG